MKWWWQTPNLSRPRCLGQVCWLLARCFRAKKLGRCSSRTKDQSFEQLHGVHAWFRPLSACAYITRQPVSEPCSGDGGTIGEKCFCIIWSEKVSIFESIHSQFTPSVSQLDRCMYVRKSRLYLTPDSCSTHWYIYFRVKSLAFVSMNYECLADLPQVNWVHLFSR